MDKIENKDILNEILRMFEGIPISLCKCGSSPEVYDSYFTFSIYCRKCNGHSIMSQNSPPSWDDKQKTIDQWNKMVRN